MRASRRPMGVVLGWVWRQPPKVKAFLTVVAGMAALVCIRFIVHDHDNLFVTAEAVRALGIAVLIYKLTKEKTCAESVLVFDGEVFQILEAAFTSQFSVKENRVHPSTSHIMVNRICWAFCVYLEAVSVLPQLRLMQNTKASSTFEFPFQISGSQELSVFWDIS